MSPFAKRLLGVLVGVLALIAVTLLLFRYLSPAPAPVVVTNGPAGGGLPSASGVPAPAAATRESLFANVSLGPTEIAVPAFASADQQRLQALITVSRDFAERYGSYSSDGEFSNLETLLPLMTEAYRAATQAVIEKGRSAPASASFVGVTTKALAVKPVGTVSAATASATVKVQTQRTTVSGGSRTVSYETLTLVLKHQNGVWRADSAAWSKP